MPRYIETLLVAGAVVVAVAALAGRTMARPARAAMADGGGFAIQPLIEQTRQQVATTTSPLDTNVSTDPADVGSYTPTGDGLVATTADTLQTDSGILGTGGGAASSPYGSDL